MSDSDTGSVSFSCTIIRRKTGLSSKADPLTVAPRRAQYDLCVNHLVLDGYDRRGATVSGAALEDNPVFRRMIVQLEPTEPGSGADP